MKVKATNRQLAVALRRWNWLVAAVHFTSFVTLLILTLVFRDRQLRVPLWTDFVDSSNEGVVEVRAVQPLAATLLPFPLITALFHAAQAMNIFSYNRYALDRGVTPHRWIEYTITNGLMTWSVFVLAGARNILLPVTGLFLNALMNFFGYLHELLNSEQQKSLFLLWTGFVPWLPLWIVPIVYFVANAGSLPLYVGFAVFGTFLLSVAFTVPLQWRYFIEPKEGFDKEQRLQANFAVERAYLLLSLTAKLYLDWTVVIGNLVSQ